MTGYARTLMRESLSGRTGFISGAKFFEASRTPGFVQVTVEVDASLRETGLGTFTLNLELTDSPPGIRTLVAAAPSLGSPRPPQAPGPAARPNLPNITILLEAEPETRVFMRYIECLLPSPPAPCRSAWSLWSQPVLFFFPLSRGSFLNMLFGHLGAPPRCPEMSRDVQRCPEVSKNLGTPREKRMGKRGFRPLAPNPVPIGTPQRAGRRPMSRTPACSPGPYAGPPLEGPAVLQLDSITRSPDALLNRVGDSCSSNC